MTETLFGARFQPNITDKTGNLDQAHEMTNGKWSKEDLEWLDRLKWTYAKTMPQWPHEYIKRSDNEAAFVTLFDIIQDHGKVQRFKPSNRWFRYWEPGNGYKYWAVDNLPIKKGHNPVLEKCFIINRATVESSAQFHEPVDEP